MNSRLKKTLITALGLALCAAAMVPGVPAPIAAALTWLGGLALGKEHLPSSVQS